MENLKYKLGEEVKIKTATFERGLILARGVIESIDGGKCEMYLLFFGGERKGYFSEFEIDKVEKK